jgi:hypothetical protein
MKKSSGVAMNRCGNAWRWLAICLVPALAGSPAAAADNGLEIDTTAFKYSAQDGISKEYPPTFDLHISSSDFVRPLLLQQLLKEKNVDPHIFDPTIPVMKQGYPPTGSIGPGPEPLDEKDVWLASSLAASVVTAVFFPEGWIPVIVEAQIFSGNLAMGPFSDWVDKDNGGPGQAPAGLDVVDELKQLKLADFKNSGAFLHVILDHVESPDVAGVLFELATIPLDFVNDGALDFTAKTVLHIRIKKPAFRVAKALVSPLLEHVEESIVESGEGGSNCPVIPRLPGQVVATPVICPNYLTTESFVLSAQAVGQTPSAAIVAPADIFTPAATALPAISALVPLLNEQPMTVTVSRSAPGTLIYHFRPLRAPPSPAGGSSTDTQHAENLHGLPLEVELNGPNINGPLSFTRHQ